MLKPMNTRKNSIFFFFFFFFTPSQSPHRDFKKKGRLTRAGGDLARKITFFMIHNPQKLVHMQRRALAAESDYVRKIASSQSSSSLSFSADAREKGRSLFSLIGHIQLLIHYLRASAAVGPESREADGCPSFLGKGQDESEAFT